MAVTETSTISNAYRDHFSKKLLQHAVQATVLDQFGESATLPKQAGVKTIRLFRRVASTVVATTGLVANVQTLTEGTAISTFANVTFDTVDITLTQYGEAAKITDIVTMTQLFDMLKQSISYMGEDCALHVDAKIRATIAGSAGIDKMYAQGNADFATLSAASTPAAIMLATDVIRAVTQLRINRAQTFEGGMYVGVISPQIEHDLQQDPDWVDAANYGDPQRRFKGEIKNFAGARFVLATVPHREATENTYSGTGVVFRTFFLGRGAYGIPALEGDKPMSPGIITATGADKADPLDQTTTVGWKHYWGVKVLNNDYGISMSSKTSFA